MLSLMEKNMKFICLRLSGNTPVSAENLNKIQSDLKSDAESKIAEEIDKKHKMNDNGLLFKGSDIIAITPSLGTNHSSWGGSYYYKIGTKVHIHLGINLNTNVRSEIFNMPRGYRPKRNYLCLRWRSRRACTRYVFNRNIRKWIDLCKECNKFCMRRYRI